MARGVTSETGSGIRRDRRWLAVAIIAAAATLGAGPCVLDDSDITQPIRFNHKLHVAQDMECTACHEGSDSKPHATLPVLDKCMECHSEALSDDPEEEKVRAHAGAATEIPWIRVNRLPGHVYFSHRAHVKWAELACARCHGEMAERETPVTSSQIDSLTMAQCIGCHRAKGAGTDCLTCHK